MWMNSQNLSSKFPISNDPLYLLSSASSSAKHGSVRSLLLSHTLSQSHAYSPSSSPSDSLKLGLHRSDGVGALSAAADLPSLASRASHLARYYGQCYWELSKARLSMLVVATSGTGFILGSGHAIDFAGLCCTCAGTMMVAASANSLNQVFEKLNDAKMNRTKNRPLPSGRITIPHAVTWASAAGLAGTALLASKVVAGYEFLNGPVQHNGNFRGCYGHENGGLQKNPNLHGKHLGNGNIQNPYVSWKEPAVEARQNPDDVNSHENSVSQGNLNQNSMQSYAQYQQNTNGYSEMHQPNPSYGQHQQNSIY